MMNYEKFYSDRVKPMKGSAIREMFKRMADPSIISLAGGNPASELFPGKELSEIFRRAFELDGISTCPHGRPISIKLTKYQIEKMFGRIQ